MNLFETAEDLARNGYEEWFRRFPDVPNPTDINTQEKHKYCAEVGFETWRAMNNYRKKGADFVKADYWVESQGPRENGWVGSDGRP